MAGRIQFQIASLCFYIIIACLCFVGKQLPTKSNRIFRLMVLVGGINLVFDMATVCSLYHFDEVPVWLNRFLHQCFIGSLNLFLFLLYQFVIALIHPVYEYGKRMLLQSIPFAVSMVFVLFGDLNYHHEDGRLYSYGTMASTIFISIGLYLAFTVCYTIRYRKVLKRRTKFSILGAVFGEVLTGIIQMLHPQLLLSGLALTLILEFLFCSLANPSEYIEKETNIVNRYGFHQMLKERFATKEEFFTVIISFDNLNLLTARFGQEFTYQILHRMAQFMESDFGTSVYHTRTKQLCMLVDKNIDFIREISRHMMIQLEGGIHINQTDVMLNARVIAVESPKYSKNAEELLQIMDFVTRKGVFKKEEEKQLVFYDDQYAKMLSRYLTLEKMIKDAIDQDGFTVVYQPIYSKEKKGIHSCEALVRLKDTDTLGYVSPEEFIPIAEQSGVIGELGYIVFRKVCEFVQKEALREKGIDYIEVNLSSIQYMNPNLASELHTIMKSYELSGSYFNFEITESAALEQNEVIQKNIQELLLYGCKFSMDDYGTGYSNLSMMVDMPYHIIKLDKSLIWHCYPPKFDTARIEEEKQKKNYIVLNSTIQMIKKLDYQIVAEGVEDKDQLRALLELGVDYIQGYYFSKPVSGRQFCEKIDEWNDMESLS